MYAGVMVFEPRVFDYMRARRFQHHARRLPASAGGGRAALRLRASTGYWRVLDTPADLAAGRAGAGASCGTAVTEFS